MGRSPCAHHDIALESGSTAPLILNLSTSFRTTPLYPQVKSPRYSLNKKAVWAVELVWTLVRAVESLKCEIAHVRVHRWVFVNIVTGLQDPLLDICL
jgi:hypothetical protein